MTFRPNIAHDIAHNMARHASLAYDDPKEVMFKLDMWGYDPPAFYNEGGTQSYITQRDKTAIVAFRGTQPTKIEDWIADLKFRKVNVNGHKIHRGFYDSLQMVAEPMEDLVRTMLANGAEKVYVTGHSMGASLAALFTFFNLQRLGDETEVYLFGCPRTFGRKSALEYQYEFGGNTHRFVNGLDIVSRIVPWHWGYRHIGRHIYFDTRGKIIHEPSLMRRVSDWVTNGTPLATLTDSLFDHYIEQYVRLTVEFGFGEKTA